MPDEKKTLLKFEGDAESVKRAAAESKASVESVAQATTDAYQKQDHAAGQSEVALNKVSGAAQGTKKAADDLNEGFRASTHGAGAFVETLNQVHPSLGRVGQALLRFGEVGKFAVGGLGATVTAIGTAFLFVGNAIDEARRRLEAFEETQGRIAQKTRDRETSVSGQLRLLGVGGDGALDTASRISQRLEQQGVEDVTARRVAAFEVSETGGKRFTDQQRLELVAAQELGLADLGGVTRRERDRSLRNASRQITNPRNQDAIAGFIDQLQTLRARQVERLETFDVGEVAKLLEGEGYDPARARAAAQAFAEVQETGEVHPPSSFIKEIGSDFYDISILDEVLGPSEVQGRREEAQRVREILPGAAARAGVKIPDNLRDSETTVIGRLSRDVRKDAGKVGRALKPVDDYVDRMKANARRRRGVDAPAADDAGGATPEVPPVEGELMLPPPLNQGMSASPSGSPSVSAYPGVEALLRDIEIQAAVQRKLAQLERDGGGAVGPAFERAATSGRSGITNNGIIILGRDNRTDPVYRLPGVGTE